MATLYSSPEDLNPTTFQITEGILVCDWMGPKSLGPVNFLFIQCTTLSLSMSFFKHAFRVLKGQFGSFEVGL